MIIYGKQYLKNNLKYKSKKRRLWVNVRNIRKNNENLW